MRAALLRTVLNAYEDSLNDKSAAAKRDWATSVLVQLTAALELDGTTFEVHAGSSYRTGSEPFTSAQSPAENTSTPAIFSVAA